MKKTFRLISVLVSLVAAGAVAQAQQAAKVPRIGLLRIGSPPNPFLEAFRQGLKELGYIEGKNITIEYRWAEGKEDRLPDLAADLVRLKVDVIAVGGSTAILAVMKATRTIPVVMGAASDPVGSGFVASLARPGGNITGLSLLSPELGGKRLELLKEIVPGISRVAVFVYRGSPAFELQMREAKVAAQSLRLRLYVPEVRGPDDYERAFETAKKERAGAINFLSSALFTADRKRLVDLTMKSRLPTIYDNKEFVEVGGLMSYGPSITDSWRRAATYVDKILKGAKPADLPVEQPMKFELIINLKAAKQIGLTIPQSVLFRADKVIR